MSLYSTLGVAVTATRKEIKTAYLKLAAKLHPDKDNGDEEQFKTIKHAYEVLSNADKRAHYDQTGEENTRKNDPNNAIMAIFKRILDSGDFDGNIINRVIQHLEADIAKIKRDLIQIDLTIKKLKKQKGRVTAKGENFFELLLDGKLADLDKSKENMNTAIDQGTQLITMVSEYSDEKPQERAPLFSFDQGLGNQTGFFPR